MILFLPILLLLSFDSQPPAQVPGPSEEITVITASRTEQPISDAVSVVTVINRQNIRRTPSLVLDDLLRSVPGFSLLRRSSSLVAHPTTQGVSLRSLGASGASRTLVLFDGIPLNDPVGGWVYWNRIPLTALSQVEVSRGATSQLYGSSALGGTIQLISRQPEGRGISIKAMAGNAGIRDIDATVTDRQGDWSYLLSGRVFDSTGYYMIGDRDRGPIDTRAASEFQTFFGRLTHKSFHAGLNVFHESRNNGTRLQTNETSLALFESGVRRQRWDADFSVQSEVFTSNFSRISPARTSETLTARQRIPSTALGGSFNWRPGSVFLVGADWRGLLWEGRLQNLAGVFGQAIVPVRPSLDVLLGLRFDAWQNRTLQTTADPRVGLIWRPVEKVTVRTSAYRGFRSPTLNELYRPFRVGNIETLPNANLAEESLWGGEAGADYHPHSGLILRTNVFWNRLDNAVTNVTISSTPTQIVRQRMNLGGIAAKGFETEFAAERGHYGVRAAYLYADSLVQGTQLRVPQTPRHQGLVSLDYSGTILSTLQVRWTAQQYEDDLNTLVLGSFPVVDWIIQKPLSGGLRLFLSVENVFNRSYAVGRTPVQQLGSPRLFQAGVCVDWGKTTN